MTVDFNAMLEDAMEALGDPSEYIAQGALPVPVKLMPAAEDRITDGFGPQRLQSEGATFEVLVSAIPRPENGAQIKHAGNYYTIKNSRRPDDGRLIWLLDCYPCA